MAESAACTSSIFIFGASTTETDTYWVWNKNTKISYAALYSTVTDFKQLPIGSLIDVIEVSNQVFAVLVGTNPTTPTVTLQLLTSTSGDEYNKLLSTVRTGYEVEVKMYALTAKETTTYTLDLAEFTDGSPGETITPCFLNYTIPNNVILASWCDGFTYNEVTSQSGVATLAQTFNSVTCGWQAPVSPYVISEEKKIEYRDCVLSSPVYITWKNLLGGWDYWLFQKNQVKTLATETLGSFQKNYVKISDINNPETERGKSAVDRMVLGAELLTTQQKEGLKGLLLSNKVYIISASGAVVKDVKVIPGSFLINETEGNFHNIEFEIVLSEINTIKN